MTVHEHRATGSRSLITCDSRSLLTRYYDLLAEFAARSEPPASSVDFEPSMRLPELDDKVVEFLSPATAGLYELGDVRGLPVRLLDLRQNPRTQTTKTFASLIIVARAVNHIRETGEPVILFSPSSGNKAVALRDAVARALTAGLVEPDQLRVVTLTPAQTTGKLRRSILSEDAELRRLNPVFVLDDAPPEAVKQVGREFTRLYVDSGFDRIRLWHSLRLENYRVADIVRALYDFEFGLAGRTDLRTVHAHAVSSAFGLLGYASGIEVLKERGHAVADPSFLLVQHLATCDMVLHSVEGSFDRGNVPAYAMRPDGVWVQDRSDHFPHRTWSPQETLEHTFYTHEPATAAEMSGLVSAHGGTGVVVSLLECMDRYAECRALLRASAVPLPEDPRDLTEWSLVMAVTGVLNAIDRGLLRDADGVTIHASGTYGRDDYTPLPSEWINHVDGAAQVLDAVLDRAHT
ncbi:hypothetical protein FHR81_002060 [Actinoalloteichus hoggarensis]|uniref:Uncharacterized protein n=1 Tax=Actinoalloteichus hoggarensis TaxID=1470176 RepID=A0A221W5A7_9PSEU|nr:DUF6002 family protein [Actinoalloteichus hoggarensis]ASO21092.1 hypothetical protein AHOG_17335 [Actinoalloteichus hoggarensis]MBB5921022.1 hypothetical protein [Actinoalloteichus hoggarensis]